MPTREEIARFLAEASGLAQRRAWERPDDNSAQNDARVLNALAGIYRRHNEESHQAIAAIKRALLKFWESLPEDRRPSPADFGESPWTEDLVEKGVLYGKQRLPRLPSPLPDETTTFRPPEGRVYREGILRLVRAASVHCQPVGDGVRTAAAIADKKIAAREAATAVAARMIDVLFEIYPTLRPSSAEVLKQRHNTLTVNISKMIEAQGARPLDNEALAVRTLEAFERPKAAALVRQAILSAEREP